MNRAARELWQQYLGETDPTAKEMLYLAYIQAVMREEPDPKELERPAA